jgi:ATP-binding cassette subfamily F protein 3
MISVSNVTLFFGGQELYSNISLSLTNADKVGLTGKNGAGKSTLLKLILGEFKADTGVIAIPKGTKICYLPQEIISRSNKPIIEEVTSANAEILRIEHRLEEINVELSTREDYESESYLNLLDELVELNDAHRFQGGSAVNEMAELYLKGLGFSTKDLTRKMTEFSGGWQMRVELAKLLIQNPDVLLLDEPTNHLDIEAIQWLEEYLKKYPGAVVLISHDRAFLDNITNRTIEINNKKLYDYNCNYSEYQIRREEELITQLQAFKNQQREIAQTEKLINKFRAKASKASFAQSLMKKLDKMDKIELDELDGSALAFRFPEPIASGKLVAEVEDVGKIYGDKTIFKNVRFNIGKGEKIALIGKNGMGKSTFIKMMVGDTDYTGTIKLGHNVKIGYFAQDETAKLDVTKTVFQTIDDVAFGEVRKKVRNILGSFLFGTDDIDKKVSVLSGGEKTRLALCKLLLEPYNFLILDEPTNHLDIVSKEVLQEALLEYPGTMLVVSHDRTFLDGLSDRIYYIKENRIGIYFEQVEDFLKHLPSSGEEVVDEKKANIKITDSKPLKTVDKKLENQLFEVEKEITKLEKKIAELEAKINAGEYSDDTVFKQLQTEKDKLENKMEEWEAVSAQMEA